MPCGWAPIPYRVAAEPSRHTAVRQCLNHEEDIGRPAAAQPCRTEQTSAGLGRG